MSSPVQSSLKSIIIIFVLLFSHAYCIGVGAYKLPPFNQLQWLKRSFMHKSNDEFSVYYVQKKSMFEKLNSEKTIVMIGDSITDGCEWAEIFNRMDIANRGIGGDTTAGVLNRIDSILSIKPKKAFIMLGINDIFKELPVERVFENYRKIISELKGAGIEVIIQSTLYVGERISEKNKSVEILNQMLQTYCQQNSVPYVDLNSTLAPEGKLSSQFSNEGVHLLGDGYLKWKEAINPYL